MAPQTARLNWCKVTGETSSGGYHFVDKCNAMMMVRHSIFGAYLMEASELQLVPPHTLLQFARTSNRFIEPSGYLGAVHWAESDYSFIAGWLSCPPQT